MREIAITLWGCFCVVAMVASVYIGIGSLDLHMYHIALPWGIGALLWFGNVVQTFKK